MMLFTSGILTDSAIGRRPYSRPPRTIQNAAKMCAPGSSRFRKCRSFGDVHCNTGTRRIAAGNGAVNDLEAPDANEEYLLYQTLLGTWPVQANGEPQGAATPEYVERIQAYMARLCMKRRSTPVGFNRMKNGTPQCAILWRKFWRILRETGSGQFSFQLRRRLRGLEQLIRSRKPCSS